MGKADDKLDAWFRINGKILDKNGHPVGLPEVIAIYVAEKRIEEKEKICHLKK